MVGYAGLKESSTKVIERDEVLMISCRASLLFCFVFLWQKKKIGFKISIYFQPLIIEFF